MIDIERLRESAKVHAHCEPGCNGDPNCLWCAVLALIERLEATEHDLLKVIEICEKAEAQRDRLEQALRGLLKDLVHRAEVTAKHHPVDAIRKYFSEPDTGLAVLPVAVGVLVEAESALAHLNSENKTHD